MQLVDHEAESSRCGLFTVGECHEKSTILDLVAVLGELSFLTRTETGSAHILTYRECYDAGPHSLQVSRKRDIVSSSSDRSQYPNCLIVWTGERIPETLPYFTTKWRDFTQVLKVSIPLTALALLSVTTDPPDIRSHGVSPPGDEQL